MKIPLNPDELIDHGLIMDRVFVMLASYCRLYDISWSKVWTGFCRC